jgi:uncharacterized protein (DUF2267 family)
MTTTPILENNIHQTMDWIYAVEEACHWDDDNQRKAFIALRAVLHQLRDLLALEAAAALSSQLPLLIRGVFFENWKPESHSSKSLEKDAFLKMVGKALYPYRDMDVEKTINGVFKVLSRKLPPGVFDNIIQAIPKDIQDIYK